MLYERKLRDVPSGWGMQNNDKSFDMFFYQQSASSDGEDEESRLFCFAFQEAVDESQMDDIRLHAFALPASIQEAQKVEKQVFNVERKFEMIAEDSMDIPSAQSTSRALIKNKARIEPSSNNFD